MDNQILKLSPSVDERFECQQNLSSAVSKMMENKGAVGAVALEHFQSWDKDNDGKLDAKDLSAAMKVGDSASAASADILLKNFDRASKLNDMDSQIGASHGHLTDMGKSYLKYAFLNDPAKGGISKSDLTALKELGDENGANVFLKKYDSDMKYDVAKETGLAGLNAFVALKSVGNMLNPRSGFLDTAILGLSMAGTYLASKRLSNDLSRSDADDLKAEFEQRQKMLKSWEAPRH